MKIKRVAFLLALAFLLCACTLPFAGKDRDDR